MGEGAKAFAEEHGLMTYPNEYMVSKTAKDRFLRWQEDLKRADTKIKEPKALPGIADTCPPCQYDTASPIKPQSSLPRDQRAAVMTGTWNEGQPDSPFASTPSQPSTPSSDPPTSTSYFRLAGPSTTSSNRASLARTILEKPAPTYAGVAGGALGISSSPFRPRLLAHKPNPLAEDFKPVMPENASVHQRHHAHATNKTDHILSEVLPGNSGYGSDHQSSTGPRGVKRPFSPDDKAQPHSQAIKDRFRIGPGDEDAITDTIGAIAIDDHGNIAAGSSSGGIGMKHRGRLGPAALVGVGTAVVPCDEEDEEQITVAAVTSGTGEHMATTMASQRCAERIYHGTRRGRGGKDIQDDDEDAIMESFIAEDFMKHPGVKNCHSPGAIGVMVVKKTQTGYYFYFAHNTDSFALASMGGSEKQPSCTLSRLSESAKIAKGGRKIRVE